MIIFIREKKSVYIIEGGIGGGGIIFYKTFCNYQSLLK